MGRPLKFKDFKDRCKRYGIAIKQGSKPTHFKLTKTIGGKKVIHTIAVHRNEVLDVYVRQTRKKFKLSPDDGVSDEEFFGKGK